MYIRIDYFTLCDRNYFVENVLQGSSRYTILYIKDTKNTEHNDGKLMQEIDR